MSDLDALAQAAKDALAAAEQRGFERAIALIEDKLNRNFSLCIILGQEKGRECSVSLEIVDDGDLLISTRKAPLSEIFYQQWPDCKGSTEGLAESARLSLAELDRIIANWGKA